MTSKLSQLRAQSAYRPLRYAQRALWLTMCIALAHLISLITIVDPTIKIAAFIAGITINTSLYILLHIITDLFDLHLRSLTPSTTTKSADEPLAPLDMVTLLRQRSAYTISRRIFAVTCGIFVCISLIIIAKTLFTPTPRMFAHLLLTRAIVVAPASVVCYLLACALTDAADARLARSLSTETA